MPNNFTKETFETVYKDDYKDSDNYYRILFNSGKALQARELTQSQTIIQNEIARFGNNIFKEGAAVRTGNPTVQTFEYIKLDTSTYGLDGYDYSGVTFTVNLGGADPLVFQVVEMIAAENGDPATFVVKYTNTTSSTDNTTTPRVADGATFIGTHPLGGSVTLQAAPSLATGRGSKINEVEGDFFVQGHFVYAPQQSAFLSKYDDKPTADFGFRVIQDIVNVNDTDALFDNQGAFPNRAAPGADRYRIRLVLTTRDQIAEGENFVYIGRIVNGVINDQVEAVDDYNKLNDLLALRTKEESGDYVVKEFKAIFSDGDNDTLDLEVTPGTAYVDGYRLDFPNTPLSIDKPRLTTEINNNGITVNYGNYILIDPSTSSGILSVIDGFKGVALRGASGESNVGTCNIRGIEKVGNEWRLYVFDIEMNPPYNFRDVTFLYVPAGVDGGVIYPIDSNNSGTPGPITLFGSTDNNMLFELPNTRPESITDYNFTVQKVIKQAPTAGQIVIAGDAEHAGDWIIVQSTENADGSIAGGTDAISKFDELVQGVDYTLTYNGTNWVYAGLNDDFKYIIVHYVRLSNPTRRSKTLASGSVSLSTDVNVDSIELEKVDVIELVSVMDVTDVDPANHTDISNLFVFDGGQRDNFYDRANLTVKDGLSIPLYDGIPTEIEVTFTYFTHSSGDFFDVNSYDDIEYKDIPSHTLASGKTVSLRNVVDFRPSKLTEYAINPASINLLPKNKSIISADVNYYMPRIDVLIANTVNSKGGIGSGELQIVQGEASLDPREPNIPTGSLALYTFSLNPFTLDENDLVKTQISHKRYTMKDIAALDDRVNELYELTTLSLLETNTNALTVVDANGLARTKAGFIADGFTSFNFSDVTNPDYRASIDPVNRLRPSFREHFVQLRMDDNNPANIAAHNGDLVTLPFSDVKFVSQTLATSTLNVNPFEVITSTGHSMLSPSSDEWVETTRLPDLLTTATRRTVTFSDNWLTSRARIFNRTTTTFIQENLGDRVLDVEIIPFMRSRRIYFKVDGLRPNSKMFPFFGNRSVSEWTRQETEFVQFSNQTQVIGNEYSNATSTPFGQTSLTTDEKGQLIGSFFLPCTPSISFRTGVQEFKLLDISTNDDANAISTARAIYTSTGTIETIQRTIRTTREINTHWWRDPLAQTFIVNPLENPNGIFLSKVRVFMESKDDVIPLQVQIRSVENGQPTNVIVPGSVKFTNPADINITPLSTNPQLSDVVGTDIVFDEPVFLTPGEEYAIVLLAESVKYNSYVSETYQFLIGSTDSRVNKQPHLGSLFMSQNGSTWTADQTKDLMFELFRADFQSSGMVQLENATLPKTILVENPLRTLQGSTTVFVSHVGHGFSKNDTVTITGVTGDVAGLGANAINTQHTIDNVSFLGYNIIVDAGVDIVANSSTETGGSNVLATYQVMMDEYLPMVQTLTPQSTVITSTVDRVNGESYGLSRNTSTSNVGNPLPTALTLLNDVNTNVTPTLVQSSDNNTSPTMKFNITMTTNDSKVSPVIDLQRAGVLALENVIDNNDAAQHITTPVILDESSIAVKVLFSANRPSAADFEVYVRTATEAGNINTASWLPIDIDAIVSSDDTVAAIREYEYTTEDLDPFVAFQVKIVMKSSNSSRSPIITDLRSLALAS